MFAMRNRPLLLLPVLTAMALVGLLVISPRLAHAQPTVIGVNSCQGVDACTGAVGPIGDNSCNGERACTNSASNISDNSCSGISACENSTGPIGVNSCDGFIACVGARGHIGANSCNDDSTCQFSTGDIGDNSCTGPTACYDSQGSIDANSCTSDVACSHARGNISANSCNGIATCANSTGNIGANSCNGTNDPGTDGPRSCQYSSGQISHDSCNGYFACTNTLVNGVTPIGALGPIGSGSCNGRTACSNNGLSQPIGTVGDNSCNGDSVCFGTTNPVGDCMNNTVQPPACGSANSAPTVNAGADASTTSGSTFTISASFTDPDAADTHTATIDFGLGAGPQPAAVTEGAGSGTVTGSQTYSIPGSYTITVCVGDNHGGSGCDSLVLQLNAPQVTQVTIDIKPDTVDNRINLNSMGKLPVAILSTTSFDATKIDPRSITLAGAAVIIKPNGKPFAQFKDVNNDKRRDLVLQVAIQDLQLTETSTEAILIGMTFAGGAIQGADNVSIVPPHGPDLESPVIEQVFNRRTVRLRWVLEDKEAGDVTCYLVQIDKDEDFSSPEQSSVVVGSETYMTAPLPNGYYYWRVGVSDCATSVISPWSETWSFIVRKR